MKRRFQHPIHLHGEPYYIHVLSISSVCYYQTALEIYIRKNKKMSLNNYLLRFPTLCLYKKILFETKLENKTLVLLVLLFLIWAITQTDVRNLIGSTHATHIHTNKNSVSIIVWTTLPSQSLSGLFLLFYLFPTLWSWTIQKCVLTGNRSPRGLNIGNLSSIVF